MGRSGCEGSRSIRAWEIRLSAHTRLEVKSGKNLDVGRGLRSNRHTKNVHSWNLGYAANDRRTDDLG